MYIPWSYYFLNGKYTKHYISYPLLSMFSCFPSWHLPRTLTSSSLLLLEIHIFDICRHAPRRSAYCILENIKGKFGNKLRIALDIYPFLCLRPS